MDVLSLYYFAINPLCKVIAYALKCQTRFNMKGWNNDYYFPALYV